MTDIVRGLFGGCRLELTAAAPEMVLNRLSREQQLEVIKRTFHESM